jgi:hypothetical protein
MIPNDIRSTGRGECQGYMKLYNTEFYLLDMEEKLFVLKYIPCFYFNIHMRVGWKNDEIVIREDL